MKYVISFYVDGLPFNGDTLKNKSLGGSETAGLCLARELAKIGHKVMMFCNCDKPKEYDGVWYYPIQAWDKYSSTIPHDVSIVQRMPQVFARQLSSKINILWNHDLALGRNITALRGTLWNIDKITALSDFHKEQQAQVYALPDEVFFTTTNGIDLDLFKTNVKPRDKNKLFYAARPERGLDNLIFRIFPKLLKKNPDLKLYLATYDNPISDLKPFYDIINQEIAKYPDNIINLGSLTKEQLYRHYQTSRVYIYPTPSGINKNFAEISCITAMECQAAGLPFVSYKIGALEQALNNAGLLIDGSGYEEKYDDVFIDAVMSIVDNDILFKKLSDAGIKNAQGFGWNKVAEQWTAEFDKIIAHKNDSPVRRTLNFLEHSDFVFAEKSNSGTELEEKKINAYKEDLARPRGIFGQPEGIEFESYDCYEQVKSDSRLSVIIRLIQAAKDKKKILDVGCAQAAYSLNAANLMHDKEFFCIDRDPGQIKQAKKNIITHSVYNNIRAENKLIGEVKENDFDILILSEVLEHNKDYKALIDESESKIKKDGLVIITVPYGSWELNNIIKDHVHEFDFHDLQNIFAGKPDLQISFLSEGHSRYTNESIGWHVVTYKVDHKPVGVINEERKLKLQAPRQTVSACILAGKGCESTLRWSLDSYAKIVDEIIVSDCGLSEEAKNIFFSYGAKIIDAPNPLEHGFDEARNAGLKHATCDWVLWIDTDEKLTDPVGLLKYLRKNIYNGYALKQNHLAIDAQFNPDLPVRIFRREAKNKDGEGIRFIGRIHEHPEFDVNQAVGEMIILNDVQIAHIGYLNESVRQNRFWRNKPLLKKDIEDYPDRLLQKHFICRDNIQLVNFILVQNGGQLTHEAKELCEETIKVYKEHFLGKTKFMNIDTQQYYSRALQLLGRGIDCRIDFDCGAPGTIDGAQRYEDKESIAKDFQYAIDKADQFFNKYY